MQYFVFDIEGELFNLKKYIREKTIIKNGQHIVKDKKHKNHRENLKNVK